MSWMPNGLGRAKHGFADQLGDYQSSRAECRERILAPHDAIDVAWLWNRLQEWMKSVKQMDWHNDLDPDRFLKVELRSWIEVE